jgi:hypothetical protein
VVLVLAVAVVGWLKFGPSTVEAYRTDALPFWTEVVDGRVEYRDLRNHLRQDGKYAGWEVVAIDGAPPTEEARTRRLTPGTPSTITLRDGAQTAELIEVAASEVTYEAHHQLGLP